MSDLDHLIYDAMGQYDPKTRKVSGSVRQASERQLVDWHCASDIEKVLVFTTEEDGSQRAELASIPFSNDQKNLDLMTEEYACKLGEFLAQSLSAFLKEHPEQQKRLEQIL